MVRPISLAQATALAKEFHSAAARRNTLIGPDKDGDGLSSGVIIHRTLMALGLPAERLDVHLLAKGTTVHDESQRRAMAAKAPAFVVVLDHGGRRGPPVVDPPETRALIIDHHLSDEFPEGATVRACVWGTGPAYVLTA